MSQTLRVYVLGAVHSKGKAKQSGNPYDMAQLLYRRKIEHFSNANMVRTGYGYEVAEMPIQVDCFNKFAQFDFPCELDLEIGSQISQFGKLEAVVVGAKPVTATPAQRQAA